MSGVWWSDVVRVVLFIVALMAESATLRVLLRHNPRPMSSDQRYRFLAQGWILGGIIAIQWTRRHHEANWFTFVCLIHACLALRGSWRLVKGALK